MPASTFSQGKGSNNAVGDVQFELVGQFINMTPTSSQQFGYFTYINGISGADPLFTASPENETTAVFTFYNDTVNERVINNGPFRIINRTGTTTIYLDTTPDGNFSNPDSFRDGVPIQTSTLRQQVVFNPTTGEFTATFVNTITSSDYFHYGNHSFIFGKIGQKYRMTFFGQLTSFPGHVAGFAVGPNLVP
jgi:hypothetical protein